MVSQKAVLVILQAGGKQSRDTWAGCLFLCPALALGFPVSSADKESACSEGDPSSIPGREVPLGEGIGYPLQYSWVSVVAQTLKNSPAVQETWGSIPGLGKSPGGGHGNPL